jgi:hypothetical protein
MLINAVVPKFSKSFFGLLFFALDHELSRTFAEDDHDGLGSWSDEEDSQRYLIRAFVKDIVCSKINASTHDGANGKHDLVEAKDDSSKMGWSRFLDVTLREGKEPSDRDT